MKQLITTIPERYYVVTNGQKNDLRQSMTKKRNGSELPY